MYVLLIEKCLFVANFLEATFQAFMTNRTGFYLTRAFIGLFEGGFIPGAILMATYFYTSRELSVRLAAFWSTLNVARKLRLWAMMQTRC